MLRVGLTGNIASGKSSVADVWRGLGAPIIDADILARMAIAPGTPGHAAVLREFGTVDRAALRAQVFDDDAKRKILESIIHPEVARLRALEERRLEQAGELVAVSDIPLLFETGLQDQFDIVVLVDAPEAMRIDRIVSHRGLTREQAAAMVAAQMPSAQKRARADFVIENATSRDALEQQARDVWARIMERAA